MSAREAPPGGARPLPALFLSCRDGRPATSRAAPLIGRLVEPGLSMQAVLFITQAQVAGDASLYACAGSRQRVEQLVAQLAGEGIHCQVDYQDQPPLGEVAAELFASVPECLELRLGPQLGAARCRQVGQALRSWREEGMLLVCLDQVPASSEPDRNRPHDPYWRNLMHHWVDQHQWHQAMPSSVRDLLQNSAQDSSGNSTLCLLQTAFGLGGLRLPERLLGFDLDDQQRALTGYGWMN